MPPPHILNQLVARLEEAPRPLLVEGYRGINHCAFTTAVAELLDGLPPSEVLRQFDPKYGQFGGPEQTPLGHVFLSYQEWLTAHQWPHTPDASASGSGKIITPPVRPILLVATPSPSANRNHRSLAENN